MLAAIFMTEDEFLKAVAITDYIDAINKLYKDILISSDYGEHLYKVTSEQRIVFYITRLDSEVYNGGLNQFFFNSSGEYAQETIESLKKIGAIDTSAILEKAVSFWPNSSVPKDTFTRRELLENVEQVANPVWEDLDRVYWNDEERITEKLFQFVLNNPDKFY
jgi:hypothetical protein